MDFQVFDINTGSQTAPARNEKKVYKQVSKSGRIISQENADSAKTQAKTATPGLSKPAVPEATVQVKTKAMQQIAQDAVIKLDLGNDSLLNGLILAEVLGKPKCMRRGRWC